MTYELLRMQKFFQETNGFVSSKRAAVGSAAAPGDVEQYVPLYKVPRKTTNAAHPTGDALQDSTNELQDQIHAVLSSFIPTTDALISTWRSRTSEASASLLDYAARGRMNATSGYSTDDLVTDLGCPSYNIPALRSMRSWLVPPLEPLSKTLHSMLHENPSPEIAAQLCEELRCVRNLFAGKSASDVPKLLGDITTFVNTDTLSFVRDDIARYDGALSELTVTVEKLLATREEGMAAKKNDVVGDATETLLGVLDSILSVTRLRLDAIGILDGAGNSFEQRFQRWRKAIRGDIEALVAQKDSDIAAIQSARDATNQRVVQETETDQKSRKDCADAVAVAMIALETNAAEQEKVLVEVRKLFAAKMAPLAAKRCDISTALVGRISGEALRRAEFANVTSLCDTYLTELHGAQQHAMSVLADVKLLVDAVVVTEKAMERKDPVGLAAMLAAEQTSFLSSFAMYSTEYAEHIHRLELRSAALTKQKRAIASQLETAQETLDPDVERILENERRAASTDAALTVKIEGLKKIMGTHVVTFALVEEDLADRGVKFENTVLKTAQNLADKRESQVQKRWRKLSAAVMDVDGEKDDIDRLREKTLGLRIASAERRRQKKV